MLLRFCLDRVHRKNYHFVLSLVFLALSLASCTTPWNASTPSPTHASAQPSPTTQLSYAALGASDGWGTGAQDPDEQNWPAILAQKLGGQTHLVNLGIPGITLHDALNVELPVALDAHPELVTVWLAVDDLLANIPVDNYTDDLNLLLTRLQAALPHAHILLANIPDLALLPRFRTEDQDTIQSLQTQITAYNAAIDTIVQRHQVVLVDLYKQWNLIADHPEYISSDGFHPSTLGYYQLAGIFYQTLKAIAFI